VLKGDSTITFASPPSVDPGDLIAIKDADDFSFSAFRDYYRKGEFAKVASVSGNVVSVYGVIQDDYLLSGSIEVYKITPVKASISGLSIVGPTIANGWGVYVSFSEGAAVENLNIKGVARTALAINQSSGVRISNCSVGDDAIDANGTDYGIQISGCQDALISNCSGYAVRHAFTTGGTDGIVNRNIRVVGGSYNSISNAVTAFDFHGNTLDSSVDGAKINGGAALSGDFISMVNCNVIGDTQNLQAVLFDEMVGHTHSVTGCKITSRSFFSNRGSCLYFVPTAETAKGGQIICSSNTFIIEEPTSGEDVISVRLANTAFTGAEEIQFTASGNSFDSVGDSVAIQVYEGLGNASYRVQISGNNCNRSSIAKVWTASGLLALKNVNITGNICERGAGEGVHIRGALNSLVSGNLISESEKTPIYIEGGNDANRAESCKVIGNSFSNCVRANLGTGSVNSDKSSNVWLRYHDKIHISENIGGSRYIKLFVTSTAGFAPGDIITGGTSGATAVLDNIETDDSLMVLMDRGSAPFTNTETISNGAGGSETLNANQETVQKLFAVRDALHLWHSANFDPEANLGEALTNVTNNNPY